MDAVPELFVVVARERGRIREVAAFTSHDDAHSFCNRLEDFGRQDIVLTSTYLDRPFLVDEMYDDQEWPSVNRIRDARTA